MKLSRDWIAQERRYVNAASAIADGGRRGSPESSIASRELLCPYPMVPSKSETEALDDNAKKVSGQQTLYALARCKPLLCRALSQTLCYCQDFGGMERPEEPLSRSARL